MLPPSTRDAGAKARAAAAAAVAAASVTPGQRDRAIQQAVLAAQNAREAAATAAASAEQDPSAETEQGSEAVAATAAGNGAPSAPGTYDPPEWSGLPDGAEFGLEVLKNGTLLEEKPLTGQAYFTFGRSPTADVLLEHPTASRLHAVLQFKDATKEVFLYDCGSTHGTFLNKNRLKARVHAPMRVGDTVRFGQSSRMYVLTGPQELLPQEGLSKQQQKQLKLLEAAQRQKEADEAKARAQMEAALASGADGATWGMGPDIEDYEQAGPGQEVNWRAYVDKHGGSLTDRQTKLLDKIRKREYKIKNLEAECAKIAAKEKSEGGLTQGQASTLVRNERALDALREELEELEDQMTDCITDSIKGKQAAKEGKEAKRKRKWKPDSDDEYANRSDSDDEFYDRTVPAQAAAAGAGSKKQAGKGAKGQPTQQVESAESLYAKRSALIEEKERLEAAIAEEQQQLQQQQQQHKQRQPAAAADGSHQQQQPQQDAQADPIAAAAAQQEEAVDSLDAFMEDVAENLEMDKLTSLKKELESIQQQLQRTERLIQIADPDGWYKPGSGSGPDSAAAAAAAKAAKEAAKAALEADRQRRAAAVAAQRAGWAAANANEEVQPEVEENEDEQAATAEQPGGSGTNEQQQQQASKAPGTGNCSSKLKPVVLKPKGMLATAALRQTPTTGAANGGSNRSGSDTTPASAAAVAAATGGEDDRKAAAAAAAQQLMKEFAQPVAAAAAKRVVKGPTMPPPGYKAAASAGAKLAQERGSNISAAAAARVAASIAILTSHRTPLDAEAHPDDTAAAADDDGVGGEDGQGGWLPPAEQTGDGKTSLNAKFGY